MMPLSDRWVNAAVVIATASMIITSGVVIRREFFAPANAAQSPTDTVQGAKDRELAEWPALVAKGHRIGPSNAPVTILEFADFECPACRKFYHDLEAVRAKNPDKIALVYRHWPLAYHRFAYPAARASECAAAQARFEAYYHSLYTKQDSLGLLTFREMAVRSQVPDLASFDECMNVAGTIASVEDDQATVKALGALGTPTLIVNGVMLARIPSAEQLEDLVKRTK